MTNKGSLFIIPSFIANSDLNHTFPVYNVAVLANLKYFVVENVKQFRAFLANCGIASPYDHLHISEINKTADFVPVESIGKPLLNGFDMGLVSDAGCPGIADPGADIVKWAHTKEINIFPLIGPSSIYLALMASGLNGQKFCFNGYLPIKDPALKQELKQLESVSIQNGSTQLFIEAPYRNLRMFKALVANLKPSTKLCIAAYISAPNQIIRTKTISEWKELGFEFEKEPVIFLFQA